jgi:HD superfamily phosphodiesterase
MGPDATVIEAADRFAERSHLGHLRKGTERPYVEHPREVARLLAEAGAGEDVVVAGLLHDTVEDTGVTVAELREAFGPRVAGLVAAVSEDKSRSWEERKRHTVGKLASASADVLLLTAADKLANARAIGVDGDGVWARFNRPFPLQRRYYRAAARALERRAADAGGPLAVLVTALRTAVDEGFPPDAPLPLQPLLEAVHADATGASSPLHGEEHWLCVAATGLALLEPEPLADPLVVLCFGLLHDTMRLNDGYDPEHGRRAAGFARGLHANGLLPLEDFQLAELEDALARHADGQRSELPTTGVCWDADRLHLPRVGTAPRRDLLSTPLPDLPEAIRRAAELRTHRPGWDELHAAALAAS